MAGRRDIEAGAAFIRLYLKNNELKTGLMAGIKDVAAFAVKVSSAVAALRIGDQLAKTVQHAFRLAMAADPELAGKWAQFTQTVNGLLEQLAAKFVETFDIKGKLDAAIAIGGALAAGRFDLVGRLAIESLNAAILDGLALLADLMGEGWGDVLGTISTNSIEENWNLALSGMAAGWDAFVSGVTDVFTTAANAIIRVWQQVTSWIADKIIENQRRLKDLLDLVGLGERLLGPDIAPGDIGQAKQLARQQIGGTAAGLSAALERQRAAAANRAAESSRAFGDSLVGGGERLAGAAAGTRSEIASLMEQIVAVGGGPKAAGITAPANAVASFGTFSAAAAAAAGGAAGSAQERIARGTEKTNKQLDKLNEINVSLLLAMTGLAGGLRHT